MTCKILSYFGLIDCCKEKNILQTTLKSNYLLDTETSESNLTSLNSISSYFDSQPADSCKKLQHIKKNDLVKLNISIGKKKIKAPSYFSGDSRNKSCVSFTPSTGIEKKKKFFGWSSRDKSNYEKLCNSRRSSTVLCKLNKESLENKLLLLQKIKNDRELSNNQIKAKINELQKGKTQIAFQNLKHMRQLLINLKDVECQTKQKIQQQLIKLQRQRAQIKKYDILHDELSSLKQQSKELSEIKENIYNEIDSNRNLRVVHEINLDMVHKELLQFHLTKKQRQFSLTPLMNLLKKCEETEKYLLTKREVEQIRKQEIIQKIRDLKDTSYYEEQLFNFQLEEIKMSKRKLMQSR